MRPASSCTSSRTLASWVAGVLLSTAGCSVVLDFPQCVEDVDCTNADGVELVCRNDTCVEPAAPETVPCTVDSECQAAFDETVVCGVANVCAPLATDRCALRIRPNIAPDDIVYIGSVLPRTGTYEGMGVPLENAVQLAIEDWNDTTILPGGRRVAWVACDSRGRPDDAAAATRELVRAGVTAIVGPALSSEAISVANVTAPANVMLMSPTASARVLAQLNDQGLVWRTIGSDAVQAAGLADRVAALDPVPQRVVTMAKNDLYGKTLLDDVSPSLAAALPDANLVTLLYSEIDAFASTDELRAEYGVRVAAAFDSQPDTIVVLGSVEARELVLFYLEAWANADPRPPLPRFVVSSEAVPMLVPIVAGVSDSFKTTLMERLEGVTHATRDANAYRPFEIRYGIRFGDQAVGLDAGLAYDATMSLLLALSALPARDATGREIAQAMARIADPAAPEVVFGETFSFIDTVQRELEAGNNVRLRGVSGPLEFDLGSGDLRRELDGWNVESVSGTTRLRARRRYVLDPAPSTQGTWMEL
jgi:ABC-type branched-subunit amino acid transport system substrate-binding protein